MERWLGLPNESASLQHLGRIVTREGRFIAFPNVLAHRVEPFKLADATKPGHRKILAMFLVDPHIRVLSTSVVPPQRKDWWARSVQDIAPFSNLPREIFDLIIEFVDGFPMSWDDAIAIRQTLMEERSQANYAWKQERREVSKILFIFSQGNHLLFLVCLYFRCHMMFSNLICNLHSSLSIFANTEISYLTWISPYLPTSHWTREGRIVGVLERGRCRGGLSPY